MAFAGKDAYHPYISMQLLGPDVSRYCGHFDKNSFVHLGCGMIRALRFIHDAGIVHADIKVRF